MVGFDDLEFAARLTPPLTTILSTKQGTGDAGMDPRNLMRLAQALHTRTDWAMRAKTSAIWFSSRHENATRRSNSPKAMVPS